MSPHQAVSDITYLTIPSGLFKRRKRERLFELLRYTTDYLLRITRYNMTFSQLTTRCSKQTRISWKLSDFWVSVHDLKITSCLLIIINIEFLIFDYYCFFLIVAFELLLKLIIYKKERNRRCEDRWQLLWSRARPRKD